MSTHWLSSSYHLLQRSMHFGPSSVDFPSGEPWATSQTSSEIDSYCSLFGMVPSASDGSLGSSPPSGGLQPEETPKWNLEEAHFFPCLSSSGLWAPPY